MIKRNQHIINTLNMISDAFLLFVAYYISLYIRFVLFDGKISLILWRWPFTVIPVAYSVVMVGVYYVCHMYGSFRFKKVGSENITIGLLNGIGIVFLMAVFYALNLSDVSRGALIMYWGISSILVILKRFFVRSFLKYFRKLGYNQKHVVIVGNGHLAKQYADDIRNNPQVGITIDGYVSAVEKDGLGICLGNYEELEKIISRREVDELIVALEPHEIHFMKDVIRCADKEGIRLSIIPFFNDYFPTHVQMNIVGRSKLIDVRSTPLDNLAWSVTKRVIDIVGSLVLIILTSPIMIFAALGVKLSGPGPIIFKQDRIGRYKKPFKMLKFRSMRVNDAEKTGWSKNQDSRKTKFGSFIRKFSIDELPQLFNVLKGDMSLIGPRPEVPYYVRKFKEDVPLYLLRQQVRPGMTGWAQVNGLRGDTSIEDRVKYDIWYIENWSIQLDIIILLKTALGGWINNEVIIGKENNKKEK